MFIEEMFWFRFIYYGSMSLWGFMEGCNEGFINYFYYFRRFKGIIYLLIIKLLKLKC